MKHKRSGWTKHIKAKKHVTRKLAIMLKEGRESPMNFNKWNLMPGKKRKAR